MVQKVAVLALVLSSAAAGPLLATPVQQMQAMRERLVTNIAHVNAQASIDPNDTEPSEPKPISPQAAASESVNLGLASKTSTTEKAGKSAAVEPMQMCDELTEIFMLLGSSGCLDVFQTENATDFEATVPTACGSCDFEGVQALIDDLPSTCADDDFGDSGFNFMWPFLNAVCTEEPTGTFCGAPLVGLIMFGLGDDFDVTTAEAACEATTCEDLFFETWEANLLTGEDCDPTTLMFRLLCIEAGGASCVDELGATILGDTDLTDTVLADFCASDCGQAFLDSYNVEYLDKEDCYSAYTTNFAQILCQNDDNSFCLVDVEDYLSSDESQSLTCPFDTTPSEWDDIACNATCVADVQSIADTLGCCANLLFTLMELGEEEADIAAAWVDTECGVSFGSACASAYTPSSGGVASTRAAPTALVIVLSVVASLAIFFT